MANACPSVPRLWVLMSSADRKAGSPRDPASLFEQLFAQYQAPILNYLYRLVGNAGEAENLTQETFTRAWKARKNLPGLENPRAWLYRIATNAARDYARRERLLAWLPFHEDEPGLRAESHEDSSLEAERVRLALIQLPPEYRTPLVLYTCQGVSVEEIAAVLGISAAAVRQRLVRARRALREAYQ
jgi:RNA polymerase sigma-70 factor, ECF subfamily